MWQVNLQGASEAWLVRLSQGLRPPYPWGTTTPASLGIVCPAEKRPQWPARPYPTGLRLERLTIYTGSLKVKVKLLSLAEQQQQKFESTDTWVLMMQAKRAGEVGKGET